MSPTSNDSIPHGRDVEYRSVRFDMSQPLLGYIAVPINVEDMKQRARIRRINRWLSGGPE